jgi:hypothetical protein
MYYILFEFHVRAMSTGFCTTKFDVSVTVTWFHPLLQGLIIFRRELEDIESKTFVIFTPSFTVYFVQRTRGKQNDYVIVLALYVSLPVNSNL